MKWLSDSLWGVRCWLNGVMSVGLPKAPVPQVLSLNELAPLQKFMADKYKMDPVFGAMDFSYDPRITWAAFQSGHVEKLWGWDCDDLMYAIRAMLLKLADATATVLLWDAVGWKHHAVVWAKIGNQEFGIDYAGYFPLNGWSIAEVYSEVVPGAKYIATSWHWELPFPDPRTV